MRQKVNLKLLITVWVTSGVLFSGTAMADTVLLKNGNVIEGTVTEKTDLILGIMTPESKGITAYYEAEQIDKVNGRTFLKFRPSESSRLKQACETLTCIIRRALNPQEPPQVVLTLKDGRVIKGKLLTLDKEYYKIMPEGSDHAEEILTENIIKAE